MPNAEDFGKIKDQFSTAVGRFADVAPLIPRSGASQAEVATRAARVQRTIGLALDCADGEGFTSGDLETLIYVSERLGTMLDVASVAVSLTGDADTTFDERVFADNIAAFDPEDLRGVAQLVSLDTAGLERCGIASRFDALAGVSAGVGPGLAAISKALIIVGAFILVLRGKMSLRRFRFLVEELFAIDGLLDGGLAVPAAAGASIETLRHCKPRTFSVAAAERIRFVGAGEFPAAGGMIEITDSKGGSQTIGVNDTSEPIEGPATVSVHYKSPNKNGAAGVFVNRQRAI